MQRQAIGIGWQALFCCFPEINRYEIFGGRLEERGKPAVLSVDAKTMRKDGGKFFLSNNGVWLAEHVDPKYIIVL